MDDIKIVDLYWARSELAITETSIKYEKYCYSISYNILHDYEDAKECVNDTFLKVWNAIPPNRPICLSAFLGKITRNVSLDRYKRYDAQKRGSGQFQLALSELGDCIPATERVDELADEKLLLESINEFLSHLPKVKRVIFVQRYFHLKSIKEIAAQFKMSEVKVTSMLFRVRKKLKDHLQKEGIYL